MSTHKEPTKSAKLLRFYSTSPVPQQHKYMHTPSLQHPSPLLLTSVVFTTDTCVPSFSADTHPSIQTGVGVTQVDLRLTVITREANWAAAAQACDGVDGPKQNGGRGDEGCGAVEAQH